jgi:hypothetical protein
MSSIYNVQDPPYIQIEIGWDPILYKVTCKFLVSHMFEFV